MFLSRISRRYRIAAAVALLAVVGVFGFLVPVSGEEAVAPGPAPAEVQPYAFPVKTARARRDRLVHWIHASGYVRPARVLPMISRIGGTIRSVSVHEGMSVRCGDTLLTIEDGEYRLALERARVGLLGAQIEYRSLSKNEYLMRADTLRPSAEAREAERRLGELAARYADARPLDQEYLRERREAAAVLAYATLRREDVLAHRSGLALAQEMAERAERDLEATVLIAPFDAEVADCELAPFGTVMPGQRMLTLLDLSRTVVDAEVLEHDIARVRTGQKARIRIVSLKAVELPGWVTACNPLVDPVKGTYRVMVSTEPSAGRIRPGMIADVRISSARELAAVIVPEEAVVFREGKPVVFVVRDGRALWRYVEAGSSNGDETIILDGVSEGEDVIIEGQFVLAHDARVSVREALEID